MRVARRKLTSARYLCARFRTGSDSIIKRERGGAPLWVARLSSGGAPLVLLFGSRSPRAAARDWQSQSQSLLQLQSQLRQTHWLETVRPRPSRSTRAPLHVSRAALLRAAPTADASNRILGVVGGGAVATAAAAAAADRRRR